jgi:DNA mismatch endonuclease (patch repair protein)
MVFTRQKVAVFLDGCFWHGCPEHHTPATAHSAYWEEKMRKNRERDLDTNQKLTEAGWLVIRVWEHEDPVVAAQVVASAVRERRS